MIILLLRIIISYSSESKYFRNLFLPFLLANILIGQSFISANPKQILKYEKESFNIEIDNQSFIIRPLLNNINDKSWTLIMRNELFFNNNIPNLENMSNRWIGKGFSYFTGFNLSYIDKYFCFSIEPFYFINENKYVINPERPAPIGMSDRPNQFLRLNDIRYFQESPYISSGFRETQLYLHYKKVGFGFSNANLWWGPGVHSSLTMTNNTTGFPHFMIGTLEEIRYKNLGINAKYIFSNLEKIAGDPFYTALVWTITLYTKPIITIGLNRNYISGGLPTDRRFSIWDAAMLVFEPLFRLTKDNKYPDEWDSVDPWDQVLSSYIMISDPYSNLKIFIELATNDHRMDWQDMRAQPDHATAYTIGLRKYNIFNNPNLIGGFEYHNLRQSYTNKWRAKGNWYDKADYDYSSYNGRHWVAHSGPDSDDLYLFFGYFNDKYSLIPSINYERHGIIGGQIPEVKLEFSLDTHFVVNKLNMNIYFERELVRNVGFKRGKLQNSNIIWLGIEKDLSELIHNFSN